MILLLLLLLVPGEEGELDYAVQEARVEVLADAELTPPEPPLERTL